MDPERLVGALADRGAAADLCRDAVASGAELVLLPGRVPADELRTIYRRRAEHLQVTGTAAIGADEAADRLDQTAHQELVIGKVDCGPEGHFFQLFFDPAVEHVIACVAVPGGNALR
jgi:hypothetical protein